MTLYNFIVSKGYTNCKSEAKRLIVQNKVCVNGKQTDCFMLEVCSGDIVSVITKDAIKVHKVV